MFRFALIVVVGIALTVLPCVHGSSLLNVADGRRTTASSSSTIVDETVPFYLTVDAQGNTGVVIYYGEIRDKSKEISVSCSRNGVQQQPHMQNANSIVCDCVSRVTDCTLQVPFVFERDASTREIVSVQYLSTTNSIDFEAYDGMDTLVVGFRPIKDQNGIIIGATLIDEEGENGDPISVVPIRLTDDTLVTVTQEPPQQQKPSTPQPMSRARSIACTTAKSALLVLLVGLVVLFVIAYRVRRQEIKRLVQEQRQRQKTIDEEHGDDNDTEAGSSVGGDQPFELKEENYIL